MLHTRKIQAAPFKVCMAIILGKYLHPYAHGWPWPRFSRSNSSVLENLGMRLCFRYFKSHLSMDIQISQHDSARVVVVACLLYLTLTYIFKVNHTFCIFAYICNISRTIWIWPLLRSKYRIIMNDLDLIPQGQMQQKLLRSNMMHRKLSSCCN